MAAIALADSRSEILARLAAVRPPLTVIAEDEALAPYETDALIAHRARPMLAAIPDTEEQARAVVLACRARGVPVVSRGAGTGISGGAIPRPDGVLLVLARMRRLRKLDPIARLAVAEPGATNASLSEAGAPHRLHFAPDPSSSLVSSIGGNVAENAGGIHCLKYGLTVHNILALRAIDGEGELLEIGSAALDCAGFDLLALMNGSEGNLGVLTEVTVRLIPEPEAVETLLAVFPDPRSAAAAVGEIIGAGVIPAALEMMDRIVIEACEKVMHAGFPEGAAALLLVELDGAAEEVADQVGKVRAILEGGGATEVRQARTAGERATLWRARKGAFAALATFNPDYYTMDGSIPRRELPDMLDRIAGLSREYGLTVGNVFHAGDGNLHPCIFYDISKPGELERAEELGGRILEACLDAGGSITGEHGVGIEKLRQMCSQFRDAEIAAFHDVKRAFDPDALLNPGRAVPTLKRCAEWGGLHVRGGRLPRPEIPRF